MGITTLGRATRIILILDARIEHLHDEELSKFAPILLGVYHPRLLLITTPSYTFNARFTAPVDGAQAMPSDEDSKPRDGGFLDPTRRTKRVFRHPDHKFEWTIREFEEWCTTTARRWGYTVHTSGIGKPMEEDGWGRDSELGYATQTAVFTRLDGEEYAQLRAENARDLQALPPGALLLATHHHVPHPATTSPRQSDEMILKLVTEEIDRGEENKILLRYLWIEEEICCACSGRMCVLIDAIKAAENVLRLHITDPGAKEDWVVELIGSSKRGKENLWEERHKGTVQTFDEMPDEETAGGLEEELEDVEWGNGDTGANVAVEPEWTPSPPGGDAWAGSSDTGGWGSQVNGSSYGGWGMTDHSTADGDWGRWGKDNSWTT